MVISKNPALIRRAETWVRRLDQQDSETGRNIVIYKAKYRKAEELAKVVSGLFGVGTNASTPARPDEVPKLGEQASEDTSSQDDATDTAKPVVDRIASAFDEPQTTDGAVPDVVDLTSAARE